MGATIPWLEWARAEIGTKEVPGSGNNPEIMEWAKDAGFAATYTHDSTAWCALFVNAAMYYAGFPGTASLLAQSFRKFGTRLTRPVPGAIFITPRGSKSWQGHTGIVEQVNANGTFTAIDGNVSDQVKRSTYRISSAFSDGFRWPEGAEMTQEAAAAASGRPVSYDLGERLLCRGDTGSDVEELQVGLDKLGLIDNDPETATFGPNTEDAVRKFQRKSDLEIDGIVGPATVAALQDELDRLEKLAPVAKAAKAAAKPAAGGAALGGAGVAVTVGTAVQVADQIKGLNDGTTIGIIAVGVVAVLAIGFALYKFGVAKAIKDAIADAT